MNIFILHAPEDANYWHQLQKHLAELQRQKVISTYHEGSMVAGSNIATEMQNYLQHADMVLLLVSPDFLASDQQYHYAEQALQLGKRVVPIITRPCMWQDTAWGKLAVLPTGGKAISQYDKLDEGVYEVVVGVRRLIEPNYVAPKYEECDKKVPRNEPISQQSTSFDQSNNNKTTVKGDGNTVLQGVTGSTIIIQPNLPTQPPPTEPSKIKPIVVTLISLLLVVGFGVLIYNLLEQSNEPFSLSVFVQDSLGNPIKDTERQAKVSFNLGKERYSKPLDEAGKTHFEQLPSNLASEKIKILVTDLPHLKTAYPDSEYLVNSGTINIKMVADGSLFKIYGRVQNEVGYPLKGAEIRLPGTQVVSISDEKGNFVLDIPQQYQNTQVSISATLYGYTTPKGDHSHTETVYPSLTQQNPIPIVFIKSK